MDITNLTGHALVFTTNGKLAILDGPAATYFEALANVRAEYANLHRHAAERTANEKLNALDAFNDLMDIAEQAAADFGLPDFHMGHVIGTH